MTICAGLALMCGCAGERHVADAGRHHLCGSRDALEPPSISARRTGYRITVNYRFAARACRPLAMLIMVRSAKKPDNLGFRSGDGAPIRVEHESGSLRFSAPFLELPPYLANVSVFSASGRRSRVVSTIAPEAGPYCLQVHSVADCVRAARVKSMRCGFGWLPRRACHPRLWRTRRTQPIIRLRRVSRRELERSVRLEVGRIYYPSGGRALAARCANTLVCFVTYGRQRDETTRFTVRYTISGGSDPKLCWSAVRAKVVQRPRNLRLLDEVGVLDGPSDGPSGCVRR
jgi:hypothetical protein